MHRLFSKNAASLCVRSAIKIKWKIKNMGLQSPVVPQQTSRNSLPLIKSVGLVGLMLASAMASQHAAAEPSRIYVAGHGTTLEQAFTQALGNATDKKDHFWIVAAGAEAGRLSKNRIGQELKRSFSAVREQGGIVYACRSDLLRAGIKEEDLMEGVASVYGYGSHEWAGLLPAKRAESVFPKDAAQSQRILSTCSGDLQSVSQQ